MKAHHILAYLGLLALMLVVALVGGRWQEFQPEQFTTWALIAALIVVVVIQRFAHVRSNRRAHGPETQTGLSPSEPADTQPKPHRVKAVLLLLSIAGVLVILSWLCLIYLGSLNGEETQTTALMGIRIVTAAVTTATALLLSRTATTWPSQNRWGFQLGALLQMVLALVGLMIMPFIALKIWNDYIDFAAYSHKVSFLLLLPPVGAVIFCLTRGGGSKNRQQY